MHRSSGKQVAGLDHLRQSVGDILSTRMGTRVMRRDYGSALPDLVDRPMNEALKMDVYGAVVDALRRWEPRLVIDRVVLVAASEGVLNLDIHGTYDAQRVLLEGVAV